ncbi:hypothetical protein GCM10027018_02490 [Paenibacillus thermoaerophilus]
MNVEVFQKIDVMRQVDIDQEYGYIERGYIERDLQQTDNKHAGNFTEHLLQRRNAGDENLYVAGAFLGCNFAGDQLARDEDSHEEDNHHRIDEAHRQSALSGVFAFSRRGRSG